jgi:hypothetical protein
MIIHQEEANRLMNSTRRQVEGEAVVQGIVWEHTIPCES